MQRRVMAAAMALLPLLCAVPIATAHPVHVSSTQVALSPDGKRFEVTVRNFTDDLEDALKRAGTPVSLGESKSADVDSALAAYLGARLAFAIDGAPPIRGRLTGHGREDDATLSMIVVPLRGAPHSVVIEQQVMLEMFDDQTNLLHLTAGTIKRSAMVRRGSARASFTL